MMTGQGYRLRFTAGYSGVDHLAPDILNLATDGDPVRVFSTRAEARQALARAVASLRHAMGPRVWPKIDIVPAGVRR